jgi:hypothetical protein
MGLLLHDMFQDVVLFFPDGQKLGPEGPSGVGDAIELAGPVLGDVPPAPDPAVIFRELRSKKLLIPKEYGLKLEGQDAKNR